MLAYQWQIFAFIQMLIGSEKSFGILNNSALNTSIMISPPKIYYVNRNDTGLGRATKEVSKTQLTLNSGLLASDNGTIPALKDGLKNFHVKKYSEPAVDGNWGNWGKFGQPTKKCDEGFRTRTRKCNSPPPRGGGKSCEGSSEQSLLFEFGRCVLKEQDTEFKLSKMGMWKHENGAPGFFWEIRFRAGSSRGGFFETGIARYTGPSTDATGDGYYLIADSSGRNREDKAIIISDELNPAPKVNRACLKFHYHMHGSKMGLLSVKIKRGSQKPKSIWRAYGDHGREWIKARVTLKSSVKFQVLFVAAIGTPQLSDIALDSIYIDNGPCKCQDEYQSCREWAMNGKCNDENDKETYYWMAKNCKTSCKTCGCKNIAGLTKCRRWEEEGYCPTHQTWMSVHCQLSCRLCACHDYLDYSDCQARVGAYECETQPQWMADKCKLSCGFCGCKNAVSEEECYRRMTMGECDSNPFYMSSNCKFSCGYCNCKNRHSRCELWAAQGECTKNPLWMHAYCTLSCGKCRCHDSSVECKNWKNQGECYNNPLYMNAFCQKSCEICKESINGIKNN